MSVPPGVICTLEDYTRSISTSSTDIEIHCLTRGQSIGLVLVSESGFISLFSVLWVFVVIFRNLRYYVKHGKRSSAWNIPLEPMDVFMLSLFSADLVQAVGAIMDVKWIQDGKVEIGSFCSAQGVIQQLGETGVAITTLVIAIYSFVGVWWRLGTGPRRTLVAKCVVSIVWLFVILMVAIGNIVHQDKHQLFQAPTPYWCWIGGRYNNFRIGGEYIWLWLTLFCSLLTYLPLFLWKRGLISPHEDKWWKVSVHRFKEMDASDLGGRKRQSFAMIAYPVVYSILVLPLSIARWHAFSEEGHRNGKADTPSAATMFVITIYGFSGALNVLLLFITRPASRLFGKRLPAELHDRNDGPGNAAMHVFKDHGHRGLHGIPGAPSRAQGSSDIPEGRDGRDDSMRLGRLPSLDSV